MSFFSKIKQTISLLKDVDLDALGKLSQKVDLPEVMTAVGELDDRQLKG
ncbi:MAG TPA: acyl-CoA dehydrogenase, partial [Flavobacteriaceae bacterium]|nr:acyl-CoA dehydrogenase [Flavobacteriaceae bacterium]